MLEGTDFSGIFVVPWEAYICQVSLRRHYIITITIPILQTLQITKQWVQESRVQQTIEEEMGVYSLRICHL